MSQADATQPAGQMRVRELVTPAGGAQGPGGAAADPAVGSDAAHEVRVGRGLVGHLEDFFPGDVNRVLIVYAPTLRDRVLGLVDRLRAQGLETRLLEPPDGEAAKRIEVAQRGWDLLGEAGFTRTDLVVGIGGGTVTDLAGFIAATWLRGVRYLNVPTTLLAMVDAAIGGKTGVNTLAGKNLVGAFHAPQAVVCDLDTLSTLPHAAVTSGLGEILKCGFIRDPKILDLVWGAPRAALDPAGDVLHELVERAIAVKVDVVAADPFEHSVRAILNYGHTLAHAIERVEDYTWAHGHAVAVGMVFAAEVAARGGVMDSSLRGAHREILAAVGLPTSYAPGRWEQLRARMRIDKKNRGSHTRMVLLSGIGRPVLAEDPPEELLEAAYEAVSVTARPLGEGGIG